MIATTYYRSPLGWIEIQALHGGVSSLIFCGGGELDAAGSGCSQSATPESEILTEAVRQLDEYFGGRRMQFGLPIVLTGTQFQKSVWNALTTIPFGETLSYGDVAKKVNAPKSARAVGAANGRNKVWIVIPCHRVIGADGSLTGYAGGVERKRWLLAHEAQVLKSSAGNRRNP